MCTVIIDCGYSPPEEGMYCMVTEDICRTHRMTVLLKMISSLERYSSYRQWVQLVYTVVTVVIDDVYSS